MHKILSCTLVLTISTVLSVSAEIKLSALFTDNMVLQQRSRVKIWGTSSLKEKVRIRTSWNSNRYEIRPDSTGRWIIEIQTPVAGGPYQIDVSGQNQLSLKNVLIGEVWLCSGQSNMDMPVKGYYNSPVLHSNDILANSSNSRIRMFHVAKKTSSVPLVDVNGQWEQASSSSVKEFSAVGYLFSAYLSKQLNVPVGIIQVTCGGSPIESWIDETALNDLTRAGVLSGGATTKAVHHVPSSLFNGMISPLVGYGIAGVIWYQGEQNRYNYEDYSFLQPAMVESWRKLWRIGNWPFFYVQIAPMHYPETQKRLLPFLREVQLQATEKIPNSGMAVSLDAGEENNIHPANKDIIAKRLAYLALVKTYNRTGVSAIAPQYKSFKILKDSISVQFSHSPMGMTTFGKKLSQFELAGSDRVFYKATAEIKGSNVLVYSDAVKLPVAVRYAFKDWAVAELYSIEGLPVSPFRSDDW
ncbi:sialate O-acetylesterase [Desertivirga xinjiangensis]|uniref:sialate O-acetylesterase n=1 Tax=Desertivirga xinjiangensis TaxID=539206 RepID=UPI00210ED427|nr:sialate O-acetylesterase [Pedobacter xinjiangensis]